MVVIFNSSRLPVKQASRRAWMQIIFPFTSFHFCKNRCLILPTCESNKKRPEKCHKPLQSSHCRQDSRRSTTELSAPLLLPAGNKIDAADDVINRHALLHKPLPAAEVFQGQDMCTKWPSGKARGMHLARAKMHCHKNERLK